MPILTVDLTELEHTITDAAGWVEVVDALGNPITVVAGPTGMMYGSRALEFDELGVATITLPSTDDLVPEGARYRAYLTKTDPATVPTSVGPFLLDADANLHQVTELPPADVVNAAELAVAAAIAAMTIDGGTP